MQSGITQTKTYATTDNVIFLVKEASHLPSDYFNKDEADYIKKQFSDKKNLVIINHYNRLAIAYKWDAKKDVNQIKETARKSGEQIATTINKIKLSKGIIVNINATSEIVLAVAEGMYLGNYQFLKYRKEREKEKNTLSEISICDKKINAADVKMLNNVCEAVFNARTLVNEPNSFLTATQLSKSFEQMGKEAGFSVEVWNKKKITEMKMGGLLSVNLGSIEPPTFTIMEYKGRGAKNKKPIVLVGKGVVYDTGGMSLKPTPNSMDYMKSDMAGAALVGCTMYAIAKSKLPVHVIALVPATDNRPDGNAYVPGDVITTMSGLTVEVLNTDAEGRMILCDALHYAKKYNPELVMDFATLTGAAATAIGTAGTVCMGTADARTKKKLADCGNAVYERLAEFPMWDEYDDMIRSDIADMKNIGGPIAGAITAGKFLQRYIDYPWMHFDIAGPSFLHAPQSYRGKGGSGVGVRLMFEFFKNL